jgi:hypothetical protein
VSKLAALMFLPCLGCAAEVGLGVGPMGEASEADRYADTAGASDVLFLPAASPTGVTTKPLLAGATYRVLIDGTVSVWKPADWSNVCGGTPTRGPRYRSPGVTGPAGTDAEWAFAWVGYSDTLCVGGAPVGPAPRPWRRVLFAARSGDTPASLPPPLEPHMTPSHAYTYSIVGAGTPGVFLFDDSPREDNYGELRIRVYPPAPAPPATDISL